MLTVRYYANGARFQPGRRLSISDRLYMRMLRARDEWDVWAILLTGRRLPPCGGMGPRPGWPEELGSFNCAGEWRDNPRWRC